MVLHSGTLRLTFAPTSVWNLNLPKVSNATFQEMNKHSESDSGELGGKHLTWSPNKRCSFKFCRFRLSLPFPVTDVWSCILPSCPPLPPMLCTQCLGSRSFLTQRARPGQTIPVPNSWPYKWLSAGLWCLDEKQTDALRFLFVFCLSCKEQRLYGYRDWYR